MQVLFFLSHTAHILISIPWLLFQYLRCLYHVSKLHTPIISVFGGKCTYPHDVYYQHARAFGALCTQHGYSVLTGGGPGSMVAANCGAAEGRPAAQRDRWTLGIGVNNIDESFENSCAHVVSVSHFFMRKWFLTRYSAAYVFFPGGIGTADEFLDLLNLCKHLLIPRGTIILVGRKYWEPLIVWYRQHGVAHGFITVPAEEVFQVCDSPTETFEKVREMVTKK